MIQFNRSARRAVLLLVAFATAAAGWEASALAGERTFWYITSGPYNDVGQYMVTFYEQVPTPMPHFELDQSIDPLYLQHESSIEAPPGSGYYQNKFSGVRGGFISGKTYWARYYWFNGGGWLPISFQQEVIWTEP